jgi:Fe-S-cluster formation regulator IscX/YfhJ
MPTVVSALTALSLRLADPSHWCRGADAKNSQGEVVLYYGEEAQQWSLAGALYLACFGKDRDPLGQAVFYQIRGFIEMSQSTTLDGFNDDPQVSHDDVMKVINQALHFFGCIEEIGGMARFLNEKPAPEAYQGRQE